MSKDPAFLFYSSDFLTGTMFMSNEQVGKYIRLLIAQHQHGGLIDKDSFNLLVDNDTLLRKKFKETKDGFYNERLKEEIIKRSKYCESRRNNAKNKDMPKHMLEDMPKHMENENENENIKENIKDNIKGKVFRKPTLEQVVKYCKETDSSVDPEHFFNNYESTDWIKANGQKVKNWKATIKTWEKRAIKNNNIEKTTNWTSEEGKL